MSVGRRLEPDAMPPSTCAPAWTQPHGADARQSRMSRPPARALSARRDPLQCRPTRWPFDPLARRRHRSGQAGRPQLAPRARARRPHPAGRVPRHPLGGAEPRLRCPEIPAARPERRRTADGRRVAADPDAQPCHHRQHHQRLCDRRAVRAGGLGADDPLSAGRAADHADLRRAAERAEDRDRTADPGVGRRRDRLEDPGGRPRSRSSRS